MPNLGRKLFGLSVPDKRLERALDRSGLPSVDACPLAVAAIGFNAKAAAAFLAHHLQGTAPGALGTGGRKGQLGLVPLAARAFRAIRQDALRFTTGTRARFLGIRPFSGTFPAAHDGLPAPAAIIALAGQVAGAATSQAGDTRVRRKRTRRRIVGFWFSVHELPHGKLSLVGTAVDLS